MATTDFPRGWTISAKAAAAAAASITLPALNGITHILDSLSAEVVNTGANGAAFEVTVTAGGVVTLTVPLTVGTVTAPDVQSGTASDTSLDISSTSGGTIVVAFTTVTPGNMIQYLLIQGHDI